MNPLARTLGAALVLSQAAHPGPPALAQAAKEAPARDRVAAIVGTATLRGRVVAAETAQPIRHAEIRVAGPPLAEARTTTTDDTGRYEIARLPAGRYRVEARKSGYLALSYGQTQPFRSETLLDVADGALLDGIDFALPRGSIISGRVVDEFGDPVPGTQVLLLRAHAASGRRHLLPGAGRPDTTDDNGEFRLFDVVPGRYVIVARPAAEMALNRVSESRRGYALTYYPGTVESGQALPVTIRVGEAVAGLVIPLVPVRLLRVSGLVVDAAGAPMSGGTVTVTPRGGVGFPVAGAQVQPDGTFTVSDVPPGEYTLLLTPDSREGRPTEHAVTTIALGDQDVAGVVLASVKPVTATGRILVDGRLPATLQPAMITLGVAPMFPEDAPFAATVRGQIKDDFTFEVKPLPGPSRLLVAVSSPDWMLRAIRVAGTDITESGLVFQPGIDVSGIEVELTDQVTEVSGIVADRAGEATADYVVVVFGHDPGTWFPGRRLALGRPDRQGQFLIRALPPGDYYGVALDYLDPGDTTDSEFLEHLRTRATPFSLAEGERKRLVLRIVRDAAP